MKREHIDLLMVHEPERPGHFDWWANRRDYTGPVIDVLDELKEGVSLRLTGLGGTTAYATAPIMETGRFDVVLTAFNHSLLWREAEPAAKRLGMGVVIGSPLQQGVRSEEDVELNVAAATRGPLAPEILARLDELVAMVPFRPTDEPACLPLGPGLSGPGPVR